MVIILTRLNEEGHPEHWRLLVVQGDVELYHDSANNRQAAISKLRSWLETI